MGSSAQIARTLTIFDEFQSFRSGQVIDSFVCQIRSEAFILDKMKLFALHGAGELSLLPRVNRPRLAVFDKAKLFIIPGSGEMPSPP